MAKKKNRAHGIIGTIIFHALILMAFIFFGLSTPLPLPGEEGVEVNLGSSDVGMGEVQEEEPAETVPPPPAPEPPAEDMEETITQETEEVPAIEKIEEEEQEKEKEKDPVPQEENIPEEIPEEIPPEEPKVNPRALYPGKTTTENDGSNEGKTLQPGDQGQENGDPNADAYEGGGEGDGISYSLGGRGVLMLDSPDKTFKESGKVKIKIVVNREGKVISATVNLKGTDNTNPDLTKKAINAALRSSFSPDPSAPEKQIGSITYTFAIQN